MGHCVNHPDRQTSYMCMKHNIYMCQECLLCRDLELYCKFRTSCPIHFLTKRKKGLEDDNQPVAKNPADKDTAEESRAA
jgi:hypothetical protein